jgi:hypothetical protein
VPFSLSWNPKLICGQATWNFFGPQSFTIEILDEKYGTQVTQPLYGIACQAGTVIEITELLLMSGGETGVEPMPTGQARLVPVARDPVTYG